VVAFRFILLFAALWLAGLAIAYVLTRDRKYVRWAWRSLQVVVIVLVVLGLLYLFERVLML